MGEFLKVMPKLTGVRTVGGGTGAGGAVEEPPAQPATLAEIGITKKQSSRAQQLADAAEAARIYLERTHASAETVNRATEIRLLAERQMGEFLKVMPKATGAAAGGTKESPRGAYVEPRDSTPTLAEIGITKKQSSRAQQLADIPAPEFRERVRVCLVPNSLIMDREGGGRAHSLASRAWRGGTDQLRRTLRRHGRVGIVIERSGQGT